MESIGDFWKSSRERFTNPFAFAYIVAWFSYNWKVTVAVFFTDKYPINFQSLYDYISWELGRDYVYSYPLLFALFYTGLLPFVRQFFSVINIFADKVGTEIGLKISRKGNVPVSKYLRSRQVVESQEQALSTILKNESRTQQNHDKLIIKHDETREQLSQSRANVSTLQTVVEDLKAQVAEQAILVNEYGRIKQELPIVKARLTELELTYEEQLRITKPLRDNSILNGVWDVSVDDPVAGKYKQVVAIEYGSYATSIEGNQSTEIKGFFYDSRNKQASFHRMTQPGKLTHSPVSAYVLHIHSDSFMDGTENGNPITFNRQHITLGSRIVPVQASTFIKESRRDI